MSAVPERFVSSWLTKQYTVEQFTRHFEDDRRVFKDPLRACYRHLFTTTLGDNNILGLGVGTGQIEELGRLESKRLTAVEANPNFIRRARQRLPAALFVQGVVPDVLEELPFFEVAYASEMLDCIDPNSLLDALRAIRRKTGVLVASQVYNPDPDYYSSARALRKLNPGAPGCEGWDENHQKMATEYFNNHGVDAYPSNPELLMEQLQYAVEADLGQNFSVRTTQAMDLVGLPFRTFADDFQSDSSQYSVQVSRFMILTGDYMQGLINYFRSRNRMIPDLYPQYIQLIATQSLMGMIFGSMMIATFFNFLEDACKKADFNDVEIRSLFALGRNLIEPAEAINYINRGVDNTKNPARVRFLRPKEETSGVGLGGFHAFPEPSTDPFRVVQVKYLVAS